MRVLRGLWEGWKGFAHRIGVFNTKLLLFVFYYAALGPVSLVLRLFRPDPLRRRPTGETLYVPPEGHPHTLERAARQF